MSEQDESKPTVWFVRHEGMPMGPFPGAKIRHLLLEGELSLTDQISIDRKQWMRLLKVPEVVPLSLRAEAGDSKARAALVHTAE